MFNWVIDLFKKKHKKKPLYTKKQFTKYSNYKGDTYVYDSYSNQWLLWYLIASDVDDGNVSEFDMISDNDHAIMEGKTYDTNITPTEDTCLPEYTPVDSLSDLEKSINSNSYENFSTSNSYSGSSSSNDWSSSSSSSSDSYSSSSYDSGSSSSFSSFD